MSLKLKLVCLILGDDPHQMFQVEVAHTDYVFDLQHLIKDKMPESFPGINFTDLDLWRVDLPFDTLEKELGHVNLSNYLNLSPCFKKINNFFTNIMDDCLHVIVKVPDVQRAVTSLDDTQHLFLLCLILGEHFDQVFEVKIPQTDNIFDLQRLIKDTMPESFRGVTNVDHLNLWRADIPFDTLETEFGNVNLSNYLNLSPRFKKITDFFPNVMDDCVNVIVESPTAIARRSTRLLSLHCYILGDDPENIFSVDIPDTESVDALKKQMKEQGFNHLKHVDTWDLDLWNVCIPIDDLSYRDPPTDGPKLNPEKPLAEIFSSKLDTSCIHVVVRVPSQGTPPPNSGSPSFGSKLPVRSIYQIRRAREKFCNQSKSETPSETGMNNSQMSRQSDDCETYIPCHRPYGYPLTLPLNLLHPIFGQFLDDAENCVPTSPDDVHFFFAFVKAMANVYTNEDEQRNTLLDIFDDYKISITPMGNGRDFVSENPSLVKFGFLITEFQNEIGPKGPEPLFQATSRYLEATRDLAAQHLHSVLPCMIVLIFGPYVAFAGAAWTDRPILQMLSPAIPCHHHHTDFKMKDMLVRHLGALRRATHSLETYYQDYISNPFGSVHLNPTLPYPTSFTPRARDANSTESVSKPERFTYADHMQDHNIFFGYSNINSNRGYTPLCIKFTALYSPESHEFFASRGFAPKIHAIERLPGGWYMIVMDDISEEYESLFNMQRDDMEFRLLSMTQQHLHLRRRHGQPHTDDLDPRQIALSATIRRCLHEFHQAGYVHGDIRNTNIMIRRRGFFDDDDDATSEPSFRLVDYDFCGKAQEVRYPLDLNITSMWRPEGAFGGAFIEAEHDMQMLDHIWDP